ncbi:MAG: hypothetical protein COS99_07820 [Candidatus Omnitrophica bacterium CG07_land_8_20_14_0_80_42_15]|uniref:DUF5666 domain-containing protein n=1 Tax=Candidatus Aquitaenariimonas noxiae TaxID=1974741 RepID=A0A2J0KUF4_9BACT|nr:MAG: hypothetical protein COS99_07820 [Candidatus Omnitrophica bacterium CG07_land_8_20_14_0_80_42_15]
MKKLVAIVVLLMVVVGLTTASYAKSGKLLPNLLKKNVDVIRGSVVAVDATKNEIIVKDSKTGVDKTILAGSNLTSSLKVGEEVKVMVKIGTNTAESIKLIPKKTTKK